MSHHLISIAALAGLVAAGVGASSMMDSGSYDQNGLPKLKPSVESKVGQRSASAKLPGVNLGSLENALAGRRTAPSTGNSLAGNFGQEISSLYDYVMKSLSDMQRSLGQSFTGGSHLGSSLPKSSGLSASAGSALSTQSHSAVTHSNFNQHRSEAPLRHVPTLISRR